MQTTDKYKVVATLVRSFFKAFSTGIIESQTSPKDGKQQPQAVKRIMLEHYEHIAPAFLDTLFYPLAVMNFQYEEVETIVTNAQKEDLSMMELVRKVCKDASLYQVLVDAYKRNFSCLLAGKTPSLEEYFNSIIRCTTPSNNSIDQDKAIRLAVHTTMSAYAQGLKQTLENTHSFQHATVLVLMLDTMNALLADAPISYSDDEDLSSLFLKVCQSQHNVEVMAKEMDTVYEELSKE